MVISNGDASLITQIYGIVVIGLFTFLASLLVFYIISSTMGLRSSEEEEIKGLDVSELGMDSYPDFSRSS